MQRALQVVRAAQGSSPDAPPVQTTAMGPRRAVLKYHFVQGRLLGELVIDSGGGAANGYLLDLGRARAPVASLAEATRIAKRFNPLGERYVRSLRAGVRVLKLASVDAAERMGLAGSDGEHHVVTACEGTAELGMWGDGLREYFFVGSALVGATRLAKRGEAWFFEQPASHVPLVVQPSAVLRKAMPPDGLSALPAALEAVVPPAYRYWLHKGAEARARRDALVDAEFFTPINVAPVDGALRRVVTRTFVYEPPIEKRAASGAKPNAFAERVAKLVPPSFDRYLHPLLSEDWRAALAKSDGLGVLFVLSPTDESTAPADLADAAQALRGEWLIDVTDTPAARAALAKVGGPFKLASPLAGDHLFAASFPVAGVEWITELEPAAVQVPPPAASDLFARALKVAKHELRKDGEGVEQRYVLGIVLEPETVDGQGDIYSADEVATSAHKWMADYRNAGYMHEKNINGKVAIIESYLAPVDFAVGDQQVKKGTWLMAEHVVDDALWDQVKTGALTGFSIGGSAVRVQEKRAPTVKAATDLPADVQAKLAQNPTEKRATYQGIDVVLDRPAGFTMVGKDAQGNVWVRTYVTDYGYIAKTEGGDGEDLDVFLGARDFADTAYWVVQKKADGAFDEFKLFLGFDSGSDVRKVYNAHIPANYWSGIFATPVSAIKSLLGLKPDVLLKRLAPHAPPGKLTTPSAAPHAGDQRQ